MDNFRNFECSTLNTKLVQKFCVKFWNMTGSMSKGSIDKDDVIPEPNGTKKSFLKNIVECCPFQSV